MDTLVALIDGGEVMIAVGTPVGGPLLVGLGDTLVALIDGGDVMIAVGTPVGGLLLVGLGDWLAFSEGRMVVARVGTKELTSRAMEGLGEGDVKS
jgi:hypothetical protein